MTQDTQSAPLRGWAPVLSALMALVAVVAGGAPVSAAPRGGNQVCPEGTTLLAKFEWTGAGYVFERGTEGAITIVGDAAGYEWTVGDGYAVTAEVVKGGPASVVVDHGVEIFSGGQEASMLPSVGRKGATPDISNVQLCGGTVETGEDDGSGDGGTEAGGPEDGGTEDGGSGDGGSDEDDLPVAT